ncbi:MAG: hypothetical protein CVT92_06615 [Bacteroidetes bacterium HGW-Bacteroidetes-1]|jgi:hypothetical protein|nr:MAG: hypothetical protein CVT92_06615 [Bacteroidetes bacterium HGW-Bacteroidetes-1]
MKNLLYTGILFSLLIIPVMSIQAQDMNNTENKNTGRKAKREIRREAKKQVQQVRYDSLLQIVSDTNFVFEAHTVYGKRGNTTRLNLMTNFFSLSGKKANIQLAYNQQGSIRGQNATGRLIQYNIRAGAKDKLIVINGAIEPNTRAGQVLFILTIFSGGNAKLEMIPLNSNRFILDGQIVPPENSGVYKTLPDFKQ